MSVSPGPSSPPPSPGPRPLSPREAAALETIAHRERALDPQFDALLTGASPAVPPTATPETLPPLGSTDPTPPAPRRVAALGVAVVLAVLAGFVVPGFWLLAGVAALFLVAVPVGLVVWAWRQERTS